LSSLGPNLVVVLEDLHGLDPPSGELLLAWACRLAEVPGGLVTGGRPPTGADRYLPPLLPRAVQLLIRPRPASDAEDRARGRSALDGRRRAPRARAPRRGPGAAPASPPRRGRGPGAGALGRARRGARGRHAAGTAPRPRRGEPPLRRSPRRRARRGRRRGRVRGGLAAADPPRAGSGRRPPRARAYDTRGR